MTRSLAAADSPHSRARALKVTYLLLATFFALGSAALGLAVGDLAAALLGLALGSFSFALGVLGGAYAGIAPAHVTRSRTRRLAVLLIASAVAGVVLTVLAAATGATALLLAIPPLPVAAGAYSAFLVAR